MEGMEEWEWQKVGSPLPLRAGSPASPHCEWRAHPFLPHPFCAEPLLVPRPIASGGPRRREAASWRRVHRGGRS